jgi:hypothetical protein
MRQGRVKFLFAAATSVMTMAACAGPGPGPPADARQSVEFEAGPVASFRIPAQLEELEIRTHEESAMAEAFEALDEYPPAVRAIIGKPIAVVSLQRPDCGEFTFLCIQAGTMLDQFMKMYFPVPAVGKSRTLHVGDVVWSYEILDDGFTAATIVGGYRVRLGDCCEHAWSDAQVRDAIEGVSWRR